MKFGDNDEWQNASKWDMIVDEIEQQYPFSLDETG
jgi:hypothetical protein